MNTISDSLPEYQLDEEEQDILDSYERGEWTSVGATTVEQFQEYAKLQPLITRELHLTLPNTDIVRLQRRAETLGISIQELVAEILHSSLEHEETA